MTFWFASGQRSPTPHCNEYGGGEIRSYYKAGLKPFSWSVLILFLPYCLPDHTSSHSHPAAGQEEARLSRAAESGIYPWSRGKAAGILEWLQITDLSPGDRARARIQLLACQSQLQLNYTLSCSAKQPLWQTKSPAGPCPGPPVRVHPQNPSRHQDGRAKPLPGCHTWPRFSPAHV